MKVRPAGPAADGTPHGGCPRCGVVGCRIAREAEPFLESGYQAGFQAGWDAALVWAFAGVEG